MANGGRANQFILEQPIVNIILPPEESDKEEERKKITSGKSNVAYNNFLNNKKSRIEILDYNNEDDL